MPKKLKNPRPRARSIVEHFAIAQKSIVCAGIPNPRNETLIDQIATLIQQGHLDQLSSHDIAIKVTALVTRRFTTLIATEAFR